MEPVPTAVEVWNLNRWTIREVPGLKFFIALFSSNKLSTHQYVCVYVCVCVCVCDIAVSLQLKA